MKLVITADDLGYCSQRNNAIVELMISDKITNTSLLVNANFAEHAVELAKKHAVTRFIGLHMNLLEGKPLTDACQIPSLLDADENFLDRNAMREAIAAETVHSEQVKIEMRAQIERFKTLLGFLPASIDGHQHIHIFPVFRDCFAQVLNEYGIAFTRIPIEERFEELAEQTQSPKWRTEFLRKVVADSRESKIVFERYGIRSTDTFVGLTTMDTNLTSKNLKTLLGDFVNRPSSFTCELMTHPGYRCIDAKGGCGIGPDDFSKSADREYELNFLKSDESFREYLKVHTVDIVRFGDLERKSLLHH